MRTFQQFEKNLKRYYVFDVKYKDQSWFMKFLNFFVQIFNKDFMTMYISTIGNTIYFPSEEYIKEHEDEAMLVLAHEIVHVAQGEKYGGFLFSLMYLFPQCLAALSLLAILAVFWTPFLFCLLFLLFLAPIPAPWRTKFEVEGYTMSLFMAYVMMRHLGFMPSTIEKELAVQAIRMDLKNFQSASYWFMWPFGLEKEFGKKIKDSRKGVISDTDEVYGRVRRAYLNAVTAYEL